MNIEQTVLANYAAFGRGDVTAILQTMKPDIEWLARYPQIVPFAGLHKNHQGILTLFQMIGASLEVFRFEILKIHVANQTVLVEGEEDVLVRETQKRYTNAWIHIWEFSDGLIQRVSNYNDSAAAANAFTRG